MNVCSDLLLKYTGSGVDLVVGEEGAVLKGECRSKGLAYINAFLLKKQLQLQLYHCCIEA